MECSLPMNKQTGGIDSHVQAYYEASIPRQPNGYPNGWMSAKDLTLLYNAARKTKGDVLEIGPWLGRSSTAIAAGLRSREETGAKPVKYDLIDFGLTSAEEYTERFNERFRVDKDKGRVAEAIYHPGGSMAVLIQNLKSNGLLKQTTNIIRGDFLECPIERAYGMIFCDATHDEDEIARHLPKIAELIAPGGILVFDDIVTDERADLVCSYLNAEFRFMSRQVHPSRSDRCKLLLIETKPTA
ncbi:class I SAM-dependent methyltransferase [Defluviimonas sp. SAOS-178_SWC]|uniref:class I SAM-dependent methyltransferase n=1 Tax=Defluviimonas sp. SAOS-178_SWC TaxID=3121287 RepID=UPI003221EB6C